jgi:hypothetical protein
VVEFVLAVDPEVTGEVGLSRKGRLEITNIITEDEEHGSASVASLPPSRSFNNKVRCEENDVGSEAKGSYESGKSAANHDEQHNSIQHSETRLIDSQRSASTYSFTVDSMSFGRKVDQVAEAYSQRMQNIEAIRNLHEDKSEEERPSQLNSSPKDVRDLHKQLESGQQHNQKETKPPLTDVFVCKDLFGSISSDSASDVTGLARVETVPARIGAEIVNEQAWNRFLASWQKEKDEMTEAMDALKKENKQLQLSMKCMKKWQRRPSQEYQYSEAASGSSIAESQESIRKQSSVIESLRNEMKLKGMREVVNLLQQQVKSLEEEREVNRVMHEQEVYELQQEINSIQQTHSETICRMVKMAIEREKDNNLTLLDKFEKIEQARRLKKAQRVESGENTNEDMTKEEMMDLSHKYASLQSDLDELKTMLTNEERRKEKKRIKKKKSKGKKRETRKAKNDGSDEKDIPLPQDEVIVGAFGQLDLVDKEPDVAGGNCLPSRR